MGINHYWSNIGVSDPLDSEICSGDLVELALEESAENPDYFSQPH